MARPCCPLCGDSFSVIKISRLHRAQHVRWATDTAQAQFLLDQLAPPHLSEIPGRYIALAGLVGVLLWLASGLTLLCLALPLCIGTVVEVVLGGDQLQLLHCYRQARGVWHAAYYCATHDRVFLPDDGQMLVPAEFARLLGSDGPTLARPGAATVDAR